MCPLVPIPAAPTVVPVRVTVPAFVKVTFPVQDPLFTVTPVGDARPPMLLDKVTGPVQLVHTLPYLSSTLRLSVNGVPAVAVLGEVKTTEAGADGLTVNVQTSVTI